MPVKASGILKKYKVAVSTAFVRLALRAFWGYMGFPPNLGAFRTTLAKHVLADSTGFRGLYGLFPKPSS